jgi:hypothetical protein
MVNNLIRPSDLRTPKHRHINVVQGRGVPDEYLFLPYLFDRSYALAVLGFHLNWVLAGSGFKVGAQGQARGTYSFCHSAITSRLL